MRYGFSEAKKNGRCYNCGLDIAEGDKMAWDNVIRKLLCFGCGEEAAAGEASPSNKKAESKKVERPRVDDDAMRLLHENIQTLIDKVCKLSEKVEAFDARLGDLESRFKLLEGDHRVQIQCVADDVIAELDKRERLRKERASALAPVINLFDDGDMQ